MFVEAGVVKTSVLPLDSEVDEDEFTSLSHPSPGFFRRFFLGTIPNTCKWLLQYLKNLNGTTKFKSEPPSNSYIEREISLPRSTHFKESAEAIERWKFGEAKQKKKIQKRLHSVLGKRNGICTLMSVVFCHKLALFKRGIFILQHMTNTERVAIESPLLTKLLAVTTQKFSI